MIFIIILIALAVVAYVVFSKTKTTIATSLEAHKSDIDEELRKIISERFDDLEMEKEVRFRNNKPQWIYYECLGVDNGAKLMTMVGVRCVGYTMHFMQRHYFIVFRDYDPDVEVEITRIFN